MSNFLYILVAIVVLLFMVTVHELGHYIAGKVLKFKINEFAVGFGPALLKRTSKKSGEVFSLRIIPLGGYCAFEGEDTDDMSENAFNAQKPWKRIIVLVSGVAMNFFTAIFIAVTVFSFSGMFFPIANGVYENATGVENSVVATDEFILKEGDIILYAEGKPLYFSGDLTGVIAKFEKGEKINLVIVRDGERQNVQVIKRDYTDGKNNAVGIGISKGYTAYKMGFFETFVKSVEYCLATAGMILGFLAKLITGKIALNSVGGPITTIGIISETAKMGLQPLMVIATIIGVNLAVFNILPIPALDGSRIVFTIIEWIRKKPINRNIEAYIHFGGLIVLFGFVILADILQLFGG